MQLPRLPRPPMALTVCATKHVDHTVISLFGEVFGRIQLHGGSQTNKHHGPLPREHQLELTEKRNGPERETAFSSHNMDMLSCQMIMDAPDQAIAVMR